MRTDICRENDRLLFVQHAQLRQVKEMGALKQKALRAEKSMHSVAVKQIRDTITVRSSMTYVTLGAILVAFLFSCVHHPLSKNGTLTEKIIEAYGGRVRLAKIVAVQAEGQITALMRGGEGTYARTFRRDGKLLVDISYAQLSEKRILNGNKGFRSTGGQVEEVFGPRYQAMVYQYNELNLPYGFIDNSLTVAELRRDTLNGADVIVLQCTDRAGNEMLVFVNAESYRIVKSLDVFDMGGQTTSLSAEFSDFRVVGGVLFPFRIVNYAGGRKISETIITRYAVNPPLNDSLFTP